MRGLILFFFLSLCGLLAGCSASWWNITPHMPDWERADLNRRIEARRGDMILQSGDTLAGTGFAIGPDSTICFQDLQGQPRVFPNADLQRILLTDPVQDRNRAVTQGALIGGGTGGVLGAFCGLWLAALASSPETARPAGTPPSEDNDHYLAWWPAYGFLAGAASGAVLGGSLGYLTGGAARDGVYIQFRYPLDHTSGK